MCRWGNMRWGYLLLVLSALYIVSAGANASSKHVIWLGAGVSMPAGPQSFVDSWNLAPSLGIGFGDPVTPRIMVLFYGSYNRFMAAKGREGGKLTIIDGLGAIKWYVRPKQARATPYVTAGIGAFRMTDGDIVATNFAVGFGVGVDYEISRMLALFGELRYSSCLTSPSSTDFLPLRIGIMLKG